MGPFMSAIRGRLAALLIAAVLGSGSNASAQVCGNQGLVVQVLGSGGPRINAERASSSYLVWVNGQSRVLVDAGGGAFLRFGQAGGRLQDLSLLALSHLHPDHSSDLPALLWLSNLARKQVLPVAGPSGSEAVPDFQRFLYRLFDDKNGAFQLLGGTLRGAGQGVPLDVTVVDAARSEPTVVLEGDGIKVTAIGVPHGGVPSLAYRVEAAGASVVFGSDQTGTNPRFVDFARKADVLVMHFTIGAGAASPLHAAPDVVGRVARDAAPRRLVLSHIAQFDLDPAVAEVQKAYAGPITVGADLQCIPPEQ
jgi:ribonuclease BN (tRNA processing enzyme)